MTESDAQTVLEALQKIENLADMVGDAQIGAIAHQAIPAAQRLAEGDGDWRKKLTRPVNCLIGYCHSADVLPRELKAWGDQLLLLADDLRHAWDGLTPPTTREE